TLFPLSSGSPLAFIKLSDERKFLARCDMLLKLPLVVSSAICESELLMFPEDRISAYLGCSGYSLLKHSSNTFCLSSEITSERLLYSFPRVDLILITSPLILVVA